MKTTFIDIYSRAMTMLKSPVLSRLQDKDLYSFCVVMNQYLQTAITLYNPNIETNKRVADFIAPQDSVASFTGDGNNKTFVLNGDIAPTEESIFQVLVNGEIIDKFSFNFDNKSIILNETPVADSEIEISWINDGYFNSLYNEDITLLSMALCWAWAIHTQNNQLDIDRQPSDSDFKLHAEGTTISSKIDWVKHFEEMYHRELSKSDWRPFFRRTR